ncbi:hypothetical protein L2X99_03825 [Microbacterium sp. KUDC0406]|uniref:Spy0128 family protein n=1 Tax=Microbacterium sp. KUDC0406 TaxID=2909588 RepID=UPI001F2C2A06|nr:FctA domain-containing protein [Microbacterium sp. KUDC0406]UJP10782.1 hypothetical protein L2X99_03825 [Microbacterium sp. KUDC0406]
MPQSTIPRLTWTNSYDADPVAIDTVTASKAMVPSWLDGTYTMRLCPIASAPAPLPADEQEGDTGCVRGEITEQGQAVGFGRVTFTDPGTYTYNIVELPTGVAGVTDSQAAFRWQVTVTDDGEGALHASTTLRRIADDAGDAVDEPATSPATFTNTWGIDSLDRGLEIFKRVDDASLTVDGTRPPLIPYGFRFSAVQQDADGPELLFTGDGDSADVQATPGRISVPSPALHYTTEHVGHVYYYKAQELPFDPAIPNLELSDAVWFFRIDVGSQQTDDGALIAPAVTLCRTTQGDVEDDAPWGDCAAGSGDYGAVDDGPVFVNTYTPDPADVTLGATKTLDGRDWGTTTSSRSTWRPPTTPQRRRSRTGG